MTPPHTLRFTNPSRGGNSRLNIQLCSTYPLPSLGSCILHKDQPQAQRFLDPTFPAMAELSSEDAEMLPSASEAPQPGELLSSQTHAHTRLFTAGSEGFPVVRAGIWLGLGEMFQDQEGRWKEQGAIASPSLPGFPHPMARWTSHFALIFLGIQGGPCPPAPPQGCSWGDGQQQWQLLANLLAAYGNRNISIYFWPVFARCQKPCWTCCCPDALQGAAG